MNHALKADAEKLVMEFAKYQLPTIKGIENLNELPSTKAASIQCAKEVCDSMIKDRKTDAAGKRYYKLLKHQVELI